MSMDRPLKRGFSGHFSQLPLHRYVRGLCVRGRGDMGVLTENDFGIDEDFGFHRLHRAFRRRISSIGHARAIREAEG